MTCLWELINPPTDVISSAKFHKTFDELLLVSSWDCTVRLYDVNENNLKLTWTNELPVFDCSFVESNRIFSGGMSQDLMFYNIDTNLIEYVGFHGDPITCVEYATQVNAVLSGSSDKTIKLWDLRLKGCVGTYEQSQGKVVAMNVVNNKIAVATTDQKVLIWDLRMMKQYLIRHVLNHQPTAIKLSPDSQCYVIGTNDGCIDINYIKLDPDLRRRRTKLKCQRIESDKYFQINSLDYNGDELFASGGNNGFITFWDNYKKIHLWDYCLGAPVSAVTFSADGLKLASAVSHYNCYYDFPYRFHAPKIKVSKFVAEEIKPTGHTAYENAEVNADASTSNRLAYT